MPSIKKGLSAAGHIRTGVVAPCGSTASVRRKDNVVTYTAADIMARVLADDPSYVPRYIGFVYGTSASPGLAVPDAQTGTALRRHPWATIRSDVAGVGANVLIAPLSVRPGTSLAQDADAALYSGNAVTFVARSDNLFEYAFQPGGSYAESIADLNDATTPVYMYQAILLSRTLAGITPVYHPFARVALDEEPFGALPAGYARFVEWTIDFN